MGTSALLSVPVRLLEFQPTGGGRGDTPRDQSARLGYTFAPVPQRMTADHDVAPQANLVWQALNRATRGGNAVEITWRELGALTGRSRQWAGEWARHLHNTGWATVTARSGGANLVVLHTDPADAPAYRAVSGAPGVLYTQTGTRGAHRPAPAPASSPADTYDPAVNTYDPAPLKRAVSPSTARTHAPVSTPRAESTSGIARPVVGLARPVIDRELAGLGLALRREGLDPGWATITGPQQTVARELVRVLGTGRMAKIAAEHTRRIVAAGGPAATHVQAYLAVWTARAPLWGPEQAAPAPRPPVPTCPEPGHHSAPMPCQWCADPLPAEPHALMREEIRQGKAAAKAREAALARRASGLDGNP